MENTPFITPARQNPDFQEPRLAVLDDTARVIGIVIDGQSRAFPVQLMSDPTSHVITDSRGNTPYSVVYCDRTDCARVFTNAAANVADLQLGGWSDGSLLLDVGGAFHPQQDPQLPLADVPFELVTWSEWKAEHPDSLLYFRPPASEVNPAQSQPPAVPYSVLR